MKSVKLSALQTYIFHFRVLLPKSLFQDAISQLVAAAFSAKKLGKLQASKPLKGMIKAVKKLKKFWSRKKRRKKILPQPPQPYYRHPPPTCHYCCCSYSTASAEPSAPPLPPWMDLEETTYETIPAAPLLLPEIVCSSGQPEFESQESAPGTQPIYSTLPVDHEQPLPPPPPPPRRPPPPPPLPAPLSSYQQYMVPHPAYGVPVGQTARIETSEGCRGRVLKFLANILRCFFPCFSIREVHDHERLA